MKLSEQDRVILEYIKGYILRNGYAPTTREIAAGCYVSITCARRHMERLRDMGVISWQIKTARTITIAI